jgi:cell division protein ZapA (FtsZ GTPase activity inhibitor)
MQPQPPQQPQPQQLQQPAAAGATTTTTTTTTTGGGQGSESIFGQIMKRLASLEAHHGLLLKYVEEQVHVLEASVHRLDQRVAELDRIVGVACFLFFLLLLSLMHMLGSLQEKRLTETETCAGFWLRGQLKTQMKEQQDSMTQMQGLKSELAVERSFLNHRIEALDSSITFVKRIGLVQFVSILAVLVFLGLTRFQHASSSTSGTGTKGGLRERRRTAAHHLVDGIPRKVVRASSLHRKLALASPRPAATYFKLRHPSSSSPSSPLRRSSSPAAATRLVQRPKTEHEDEDAHDALIAGRGQLHHEPRSISPEQRPELCKHPAMPVSHPRSNQTEAHVDPLPADSGPSACCIRPGDAPPSVHLPHDQLHLLQQHQQQQQQQHHTALPPSYRSSVIAPTVPIHGLVDPDLHRHHS